MNNPTILYVEDDRESRNIMQVMVEQVMGYGNLILFADSQNFIENVLALPHSPDIVLLDIHVPPYNGFEMLKMLRGQKNFHTTPIMALTASVMNEEVEQLKEAGFDGVCAKPVDLDSFPVILNRVLKGEKFWNIVG